MSDHQRELTIRTTATCPACLAGRLQMSPVCVDTADEAVFVAYAARCPDCGLHVERRHDEAVSWQRFIEAFVSADLRSLAYIAGGR